MPSDSWDLTSLVNWIYSKEGPCHSKEETQNHLMSAEDLEEMRPGSYITDTNAYRETRRQENIGMYTIFLQDGRKTGSGVIRSCSP